MQLNRGVQRAKNDYLWFVHCDTRFDRPAVEKLKSSLSSDPQALHLRLTLRQAWPEAMRCLRRIATALSLVKSLEPFGLTRELPVDFDVDTIDDLKRLTHCRGEGLTAEQRELIDWVRSL